MAKYLKAEKTLLKRPEKRVEASSALPSAADLDLDAEEKATSIATNDGMPEAPMQLMTGAGNASNEYVLRSTSRTKSFPGTF
jgi:hypothetical protein